MSRQPDRRTSPGVAHPPIRPEGRTRPAARVPRSTWAFPPAALADPDGIVGTGADLAPPTLVHAYRNGIFPWPHGWPSLPWFSPDPRGILRPEQLRRPRSLRQLMRRSGWETTCDAAFADVIAGCATSRDDGTWITPEMIEAYTTLHELGWAHSIEVWDDDRLIGGLYGVQVGRVFTGESMFHRESGASKIALCDLVDRFVEAGGAVIDVQLLTPHLASMGATEIPRSRWLRELEELVDDEVRMLVARLPVARLASPVVTPH